MECEKNYFTMYLQGEEITDQFYMDEDFNVPDSKKDVQRIILTEGKVHIDELKHVEGYMRVLGKILFKVLYVTDEGETKVTSLEGNIPFEEKVYVNDEILEYAFIKSASVDLSVSIIHSRKLNLKAVIDLTITSDGQKETTLLAEVSDTTEVYRKHEEYPILKLFAIKKDTYRIREEVMLDGTKEIIENLVWSNVNSRKMDTRISQDEIFINGELQFFGFYESTDGKNDWVEQMIPYQAKIACYGVRDYMYHQIYSQLKDVNVDVRMDEDGEMRIFGIEATLEIRMIVYEEEKQRVLADMYALDKKYDITWQEKEVEQLLMQNHSKCKITERLSLPEIKDDILQICHSSAKVQINEVQIMENGLLAEGILHISFMYVKPDDIVPFDVWQGMIPFSSMVECNEICQDINYELMGTVEQLSIGLLGNDEIEIKALLAIRSFIKKQMTVRDMKEITEKQMDDKREKNNPGIIGYIVKDGDKLWDLAKKYNTTMESICEMNQIDKIELKTGQKILIFRENVSIL